LALESTVTAALTKKINNESKNDKDDGDVKADDNYSNCCRHYYCCQHNYQEFEDAELFVELGGNKVQDFILMFTWVTHTSQRVHAVVKKVAHTR